MTKTKICKLIAILLIASILLSNWIQIDTQFLLSTIFTINGIMFSIGLGLISNFNLQGIKKKSYLRDIRKNISSVRNSFIWLFVLSAASFILTNFFKAVQLYNGDFSYWGYDFSLSIKFDIAIFSLLFMSFSILYFIYNFIEIQNLNDEIVDRIIEEQEEEEARKT